MKWVLSLEARVEKYVGSEVWRERSVITGNGAVRQRDLVMAGHWIFKRGGVGEHLQLAYLLLCESNLLILKKNPMKL